MGCVILFDDNVRDEVRDRAHETGLGRVIELQAIDGTLVGRIEVRLARTEPTFSASPSQAAPPG